MRGWLAEFPAAVPCVMVVRAVLSQCRCDLPSNGGLSAYALLRQAGSLRRPPPSLPAAAMVIHVCRSLPPPVEADQLLYHFLHTYRRLPGRGDPAADKGASASFHRRGARVSHRRMGGGCAAGGRRCGTQFDFATSAVDATAPVAVAKPVAAAAERRFGAR
eukprot:gene10074-19608_t